MGGRQRPDQVIEGRAGHEFGRGVLGKRDLEHTGNDGPRDLVIGNAAGLANHRELKRVILVPALDHEGARQHLGLFKQRLRHDPWHHLVEPDRVPDHHV